MSSLKACKLQDLRPAYLKSRQRTEFSYREMRIKHFLEVILESNTSHFAGCYWWARLRVESLACAVSQHWSCNIHLLHDPAVVRCSVSVKWPSVKCDDWASFSPTLVSCPLSRPVSLPPSVWISTSASLQADYKGFNVPFTSSMFQVVCACLTESALTHTHTHANLATLAFIRAAAPVRLALGWAVWHWAHPLMADCKQPSQQTAARSAGEYDLMETLTA